MTVEIIQTATVCIQNAVCFSVHYIIKAGNENGAGWNFSARMGWWQKAENERKNVEKQSGERCGTALPSITGGTRLLDWRATQAPPSALSSTLPHPHPHAPISKYCLSPLCVWWINTMSSCKHIPLLLCISKMQAIHLLSHALCKRAPHLSAHLWFVAMLFSLACHREVVEMTDWTLKD